MRQVTRKGLLTAAAAGGMLALSTGAAHADADATGGSAKSPGVLSGNTVQAPVHVPVQVCGNTINVVGVLNPAFGNQCLSDGSGPGDTSRGGSPHGDAEHGQRAGGHGAPDGGGAQARGGAQGSPGVASGNNVQVPVDVPVSACGNNVSAVGVGNTPMGNTCVQRSGGDSTGPGGSHTDEPGGHGGQGDQGDQGDQGGHDQRSETSSTRQEGPRTMETELKTTQPAQAVSEGAQLAQTGAGSAVITALPLGAGLVLGGVVLYRRRAALAGRL